MYLNYVKTQIPEMSNGQVSNDLAATIARTKWNQMSENERAAYSQVENVPMTFSQSNKKVKITPPEPLFEAVKPKKPTIAYIWFNT